MRKWACLGILSHKSRPFMSTTTFTIKANGWAQSTTFDGSHITYTRTQTDIVPESPTVTFPGVTAQNSPWLTNTNQPGVAIIFGKIVDSGDSAQSWQWLAPSVSDSNLIFTVSDTAGDDNTKVYVFTIGTNHGQAVAFSPFVIFGFGTADGSINGLKVYYGTHQYGYVQWGPEPSTGILPTHYKFVYRATDQSMNIALNNDPFIDSSKISSSSSLIVSLHNRIFTGFNEYNDSISYDINIIYSTNSYIVSISDIDTTINRYDISSDGGASIILNSYIQCGGVSIINSGQSSIIVNECVTTNPSPFIVGPVVYNRAINTIGEQPIPHVSSLQMVQNNLQTIYDRLGGAMVEAEGYGITRQYFAAGDFADRIWERFSTLINEGNTPIINQLDTIYRSYVISVPGGTDAAAITITFNSKPHSLYIEHEGAYYAVKSSRNGITVDGVSDGATWETLTGGDIVINGRLFYNNVSQPIVTDWTTNELNNVNSNIDYKTTVLVGGKKYPLITFKNISPSLIWINESDE